MTALLKPQTGTEGVPGTATESFLQTFSGHLISVQRPDPAMIDFVDIITALTKQCRFNGHCKRFYSVAEHTVRGVKLAQKLFPENKRLAKSFFLHDFTEAYVGDVIRPVKKHVPQFKEIEKGFHKAICSHFNVKEDDFDENGVHLIDNYMAMWEKRDLLPDNIFWPGMPSIDHLNLPELENMSVNEILKELWMLRLELFDGKL